MMRMGQGRKVKLLEPALRLRAVWAGCPGEEEVRVGLGLGGDGACLEGQRR
jgi:hypothetical protein